MGDLGDASERWPRKSCPPLPDPAAFSEECLSAAEEAAELVVNCIHPTLDSEESKRDIVDYIQRLIKAHLHCEVFSYGSVPLKTYLPDGDIDLTVLKVPNPDKSLALDVLAVLQREEKNEEAEYQVKDTQFIDAEVKLVKCLVRNFIVDISFNQLGGLSTLCFLEQVDRIVGRNHLFKRSIILVKSWCYHESRILGAHHGLISTYALETLVLYIFHHFHSSLTGPLMVLYRFLAYFSQFDWENYCVSLKGPVLKSSLPDIVVHMPSGWNNLLFSEEFLENCMDMFSVPLRGLEEKPKAFQAKHLNIMDPLRENNNLGRSVNRGNFYRIQSAFKYGARKLGQLLQQPRDKIADKINDFFTNTLTRHARKRKNTTQHSSLRLGIEDSSIPKANISENVSLDLEEVNLAASTGESEASNPLADLNGDYGSHIRSLSCGQLCHGFTLFASSLQNNNAWDIHIVRLSMPFVKNQFSIITSPSSVSMNRNVGPSANSAVNSSSAFRAEPNRKAPGTGTYIPQVNSNYRERPPQRRSRRAPGYRNEFYRYGHGTNYGSYPTLNEEKCSENDTFEEVVPDPVSDERQTNDLFDESCRIEFGSIGNLVEEFISGIANVGGSSPGASMKTPETEQESDAVASMPLKNDEEFPPLR